MRVEGVRVTKPGPASQERPDTEAKAGRWRASEAAFPTVGHLLGTSRIWGTHRKGSTKRESYEEPSLSHSSKGKQLIWVRRYVLKGPEILCYWHDSTAWLKIELHLQDSFSPLWISRSYDLLTKVKFTHHFFPMTQMASNKNALVFMTLFSGTEFYTPSHGMICFVPTVSPRNHFLTGGNSPNN